MSLVEATTPATAVQKQPSFAQEIGIKITQFSAALPRHIPKERFARVIMTAVQLNPDLLNCNRQSLWNSAMRAASDGLLPDGREGALVPYKGQVQWMPMIAGLRKKVRNSKELSDWHAQVVHAKDHFRYRLGDDPFIEHEPFTGEGDPGPVIAAYSVATFRDGGDKSREVMTRAQLDKVRSMSRASQSSSPWNVWFEEMCRKTVARRHSKILPMSTDLDDLVRRDDALYDLDGASDKVVGNTKLSLSGKLDALANMDDPAQGAPMSSKPGAPPSADQTPAQDEPASDRQPAAPADSDPAPQDAAVAPIQADEEDTPRTRLIADLNDGIDEGAKALKLLNDLGERRDLLTDEDVRRLKEREKRVAAKGGQG